MRCIFCKQSSDNSISVEHIIPESLGNKSHVLPKGIVCDNCNNYFAIKIEKEILQLPFFISLRGRNAIQNKKGKVPSIPAFVRDPSLLGELETRFDNDLLYVRINDEQLFNDILLKKYNKLYLPYEPLLLNDNILFSRLLGKIALEALTYRLMHADGWETQIIDSEAIDELRDYVRHGKGPFWPYHQRRIYSENEAFSDRETGELYEVLHEWDFLIPERPRIDGEVHYYNNMYLVCCIMGIEFAFNMTGAGVESYIQWLTMNNGKSILLMDKKDFDPYNL